MTMARDLGTLDDGRYSVAFPARHWYPACRSGDLGSKRPHAIQLMGNPLVLFRDRSGRARCLVDRCPHRNLALSLGRVHESGSLQCAYHGWCFDGDGRCTAVPGLVEGPEAAAPAREVAGHAAAESDGMVWVYGEQGATPAHPPPSIPVVDGPRSALGSRAGEVVFTYDLDCTVHAALENALDVPHTAFLHAGIFRGGDPREITAVRREMADGLEVQYLGEPVGLGRVRGAEGSELTFDHWDRFFLPSTAQVEYRVEGWLHIVNTILHLPLEPFRTRAWFVVRYWTRLPGLLAKPVVLARGKQILRQDARILARQTEQLRRFGGERFTSTDLDLMGNAIWRLLRRAERAEAQGPAEARGDGDGDGADGDGESVERTITFRI